MSIKHFLPFLFCMVSLAANAQSEGGMEFIKAESWAEVKAKAKAENKYIFLDGYTTWCGPCIMMAKKVFPQPEVGSFYNANFINLKVQLDTTTIDSEHVKTWYKDGNFLMTNYNIRAFPTYLFFSPEGELVHRALGSSDAQTFINKGKDALNPDKQYYSLVRQYEKGNRDPAFLNKLCYAGRNAYDNVNTQIFVKAYLATQSDLLTASNAAFLVDFTQSSKDTGFALMMKYPEKFDANKKEGYSMNTVRAIVIKEDVYPFIFPKNSEPNPSKEPNWNTLKSNLNKKYPAELANQSWIKAKVMFYQQTSNWPLFTKSVTDLVKQFPGMVTTEDLNAYAWTIFSECNDKQCVEQALGWSAQTLEKHKNDPMLMDTYANLLYKNGDKKSAIIVQKKAIELLKAQGEDTEDFEESLAKMEKGEKTW